MLPDLNLVGVAEVLQAPGGGAEWPERNDSAPSKAVDQAGLTSPPNLLLDRKRMLIRRLGALAVVLRKILPNTNSSHSRFEGILKIEFASKQLPKAQKPANSITRARPVIQPIQWLLNFSRTTTSSVKN